MAILPIQSSDRIADFGESIFIEQDVICKLKTLVSTCLCCNDAACLFFIFCVAREQSIELYCLITIDDEDAVNELRER